MEPHSQAWNDLALKAATQHPCSSYSWVTAYLKAKCEDGEEWIVLLAFEKEELIGVLPLLVRFRRFLFLQTAFLRTPSDAHTFSVDFLAAYGKEQLVLQDFVTYLNQWHSRIIKLEFSRMLPLSNAVNMSISNISGLSRVFYTVGFVSIVRPRNTFDDFYSKLSEKLRRNLKSIQLQLSNLHGFEITIIKSEFSGHEDFKRFLDLELLGWKGQRGSAIASKKEFFDFFSGLTENLARGNFLELYFLTIEGKTIAAYMNVNFGKKCYLLKTTYDEDYKKYSPGQLILYFIFKDKITKGSFEEISFMSDYEWQNRWNVEKDTYRDVSFYFGNIYSQVLGRFPGTILSRSAFLRKISRGVKRRLIKLLRILKLST